MRLAELGRLHRLGCNERLLKINSFEVSASADSKKERWRSLCRNRHLYGRWLYPIDVENSEYFDLSDSVFYY
jgi:hypothetical protein